MSPLNSLLTRFFGCSGEPNESLWGRGKSGGLVVSVSIAEEFEDPVLLSFAVTDTRLGIAEDYLETIFDSFPQGDNASTRVCGGSGLGLAISRQLVE